MTPPPGEDEHYRGPGRGTGHPGRRSIAWHQLRNDALTRPCPYRLTIPAPRGLGGGARVLPCNAGVGELCRDPRTGRHLHLQPAHSDRLRPTKTPVEETAR